MTSTEQRDLARQRMAEAEFIREQIGIAYEARPKNPVEIAALHDALRYALKMATLHADLAQGDQLAAIARTLDQLAADLRGEPAFDDQVDQALRLVEDPS
jgi:hypothetical protein